MKSGHEVIIPNRDLPFKLFLFEGENGNYFRDRHWHRSIEIFAVFEGQLKFYLNDRMQILKPGEFVLVNSNEIHAIDAEEPNRTVVIQIPLDTFSGYYTGEEYIRFTHCSTDKDGVFMSLIREMFITYSDKKAGYEFRVKSSYYMMLYLLIMIYRELDVSEELLKQSRKLSCLTPITSYIREHYQEELSLEQLSEQFGYAPAYISRMFQKYAGINYKNYLSGVRLEYAFGELSRQESTISEVALRHGFSSSRSFTKAFQKKYGMLPSEYLKKGKKDKKMH